MGTTAKERTETAQGELSFRPGEIEELQEGLKWAEFIAWEGLSRDTIDLKKVYIDMADGDIISGLWLSQAVYWELPNKLGEPKTTVEIDGKMWVAKDADEWWKETRIKEKPLFRCIQYWVDRGIIESENHSYQKRRMRHTRIIQTAFIKLLVSSFFGTYLGKQVAKREDGLPSRELLLLHRLHIDSTGEEKKTSPKNFKKISKKSTSNNHPPNANLVSTYIDQYRARVENVPADWKPSPQQIGEIGRIARHGVSQPEFIGMIAVAQPQYRLSTSYLIKHTASLREQARQHGFYVPPEPEQEAPKESHWITECDCGWTAKSPFANRPSAICGKDAKHKNVGVSMVNG